MHPWNNENNFNLNRGKHFYFYFRVKVVDTSSTKWAFRKWCFWDYFLVFSAYGLFRALELIFFYYCQNFNYAMWNVSLTFWSMNQMTKRQSVAWLMFSWKLLSSNTLWGSRFFVYVCDFCFFFCLEIVEHFVYKRKTARKFRLS